VNLAKELVSAAAILMEAEGRSANPEISKPPTGEKEEEWSEKNLEKRMSEGLVIWQSETGGVRYVTKTSSGQEKGTCKSAEEVRQMWEKEDSELKNLIHNNKIKDVFLVDAKGNISLLNRNTGAFLQKNIGKINMPDQYSCPAG
jgi:hypothetical protein